MKKSLSKIIFFISAFFLVLCFPKAYVVVDSTLGQLKPKENSIIGNTLSSDNWLNQSNNFTHITQGSEFQTYTSIGQYWYAGSVSGEYIDVNADFYFGIGFLAKGTNNFYNYLPTDDNSLKAENLRCAIGDFRTGYDSTYAPVVKDFEVKLDFQSGAYLQYRYHVKFNYHQRINPVSKSNVNMNCYFSVGTNKKFLQLQKDKIDLVYYNSSFSYSVSNDPNTKLLNDINNNQKVTNEKLDNLNKNQTQTNEKLDNLKDTLKSDNVDDKSSFFTDFSSADHGLSGVITAPLRAISKITATCQPVTFSVLDEPIELPCGDTLFWNKESVKSFKIVWNLLVGGPLIYFLIKKLFKVIESLKNPDDDRIEVLDL